MAELTYIRAGNYYIPNLAVDPEPKESARDIGKYGRMRLTYLKQHSTSCTRSWCPLVSSRHICWTSTTPPMTGWTG